MFLMRLLLAVGLIALNGCAALQYTQLPSRPIDDSFTVDGLRWSGTDDGLYIIMKTFNANGAVGICGAYTFSNDHAYSHRSFNDLALNYGLVRLAGVTVVNDLSFFPKVGLPSTGWPKQPAICARTSVPWQSRFKDAEPDFVLTKSSITIVE